MAAFVLNISSGGVIVSSVGAGARLTLSAPNTGDTTMSLGTSGGVVISTTMSADNEAAYSKFISDKRLAMLNSGAAVFNGVSQIFSGGYLGTIAQSCLMSLNGVQGYPDSAAHTCNLNINPSLGIWAEWQSPAITTSCTTVLRALQPCITCESYNTLFAAEMVIYHALNKVAWQNMYIRVTEGAGGYPEGLWPRYQALVTAWNFYTYKSEYLVYNNSLRESLNINVGWSNPTCNSGGFIVFTTVDEVVSSSGLGLGNALIFYLGNMLTPNKDRDNNTYTSGDPIPFIINYSGSNSGGTIVGSGASIFCGPMSALTSLTSSLETVLPESSGGALYQSMRTLLSGGVLVSDVQEFNNVNNSGHWILGVVADRVGGMGYVAQNFGLGLATDLGDRAVSVTASAYDTYTLNTYWWTNIGGKLEGPIESQENGKQLHTYALI